MCLAWILVFSLFGIFLRYCPSSFSSVRTSAVGELSRGTVIHLRSFDVTEIGLLFKMLSDQ